jgi:S-DNA-T family DNA segregation ATPase FtsK/SpoIIIE
MLFLWPGTSMLLRGQGTYVGDDEITRIVDFVGTSEPEFVKELVQLKTNDPAAEGGKLPNRDELYESAVDLVVREGRGSVSLLQRALGIGYGRAARLIDYMAEDNIVGAYNGSQAREILITVEQWEAMQNGGSSTAEALPTRSNRVQLAKPSPPIVDDDEDESLDEYDDDIDEEQDLDRDDADADVEDSYDEEDEQPERRPTTRSTNRREAV